MNKELLNLASSDRNYLVKMLKSLDNQPLKQNYKGVFVIGDEIKQYDIVYVDSNNKRIFYIAKNNIDNVQLSPLEDFYNWQELLETELPVKKYKHILQIKAFQVDGTQRTKLLATCEFESTSNTPITSVTDIPVQSVYMANGFGWRYYQGSQSVDVYHIIDAIRFENKALVLRGSGCVDVIATPTLNETNNLTITPTETPVEPVYKQFALSPTLTSYYTIVDNVIE